VAVFLFMNVFDTVGTIVGVSQQAGSCAKEKFLAPSGCSWWMRPARWWAPVLGTSTIVAFIESAAGVAAGGRTGMASVVTGGLFFVALVFSPLIGMIGNYLPVTAPAFIIVGTMMMSNAGTHRMGRLVGGCSRVPDDGGDATGLLDRGRSGAGVCQLSGAEALERPRPPDRCHFLTSWLHC
jgi:xanthine/uracil/vitamin C permease (AzgA family)